jgi:hypothetical protein
MLAGVASITPAASSPLTVEGLKFIRMDANHSLEYTKSYLAESA